VQDLFRWASFRWSQRGSIQATDTWWGVLALLDAVLGWRLLKGKRLRRDGRARGAGEARRGAAATPTLLVRSDGAKP
jgi:hypothetical protein